MRHFFCFEFAKSEVFITTRSDVTKVNCKTNSICHYRINDLRSDCQESNGVKLTTIYVNCQGARIKKDTNQYDLSNFIKIENSKSNQIQI